MKKKKNEDIENIEQIENEDIAQQEEQEVCEEAAETAQPDELAEVKAQLLRSLAEYDNYRKRSTKEKEAAFSNGLGYAVEKLLPVLDTLAMAQDAPCADEEYKKGITMTVQKAQAAFDALGITEIKALGEMFDPELHAAVMQEPGEESGRVMKVLQPGYMIGEKVIRHSTVSVAE